ncbi:MAG: endonuclease/exonuclease/phosphatase family protein [Verrucomicrobiota bacterium]|nr:endonuclease/exonuclease/phosphatase family protein [Verrucomicrobiota bacterium]
MTLFKLQLYRIFIYAFLFSFSLFSEEKVNEKTKNLQSLPKAPKTIKILNYNLYNFFSKKSKLAKLKPPGSKKATVATIKLINADIAVFSEVGYYWGMKELYSLLKDAGVDYKYRTLVNSQVDKTRSLVIFSKIKPFEISHDTTTTYELKGVTIPISRGYAHVTFKWSNGYTLELFGAHLKSKIFHKMGQSDMRRYEARHLRYFVNNYLKKDWANINALVVGDMNDTCDSSPIGYIVYRRYGDKKRLYDLRPLDSRKCSWTHFWDDADTYARIDYAFASYGLLPEIIDEGTCIPDNPLGFVSSDHRPLVIQISPRDIKKENKLENYKNAVRQVSPIIEYKDKGRIIGKRKVRRK